MTTLGPEAMEKAHRACTCCHQPRRVRIRGVWICTRCDGGWDILNRK